MAGNANPEVSDSDGTDCNRRTVLRSLAGAAAVTGVGSVTATARSGSESTQLRVEDTEAAFQKLSEPSVRALLNKLSEEGVLPQVTADVTEAFPVTTLETDIEGGVGRFETGSWFGEQYVFLAYLDDAEVQVIVSDRGYPSAVVDPVDTDHQRVVSVNRDPKGEALTSAHYEIKPAQIACDEECWCDGCACCPLNDFEKVYCRDIYNGNCIVTNRCECE